MRVADAALARWVPSTAGILLTIAGYFLFSLQDATVKWLVAGHPVTQILFMRSITIAAVCLLVGRERLVRRCIDSPNKLALLLRGALILVAWSCYYTAARSLQLAQLVTIYFAAPLIVTVLSVLILGERVRWPRWIGVGLGFVGVAIACNAGRVGVGLPAALVLLAASLWAYANVLVRQISRTEATLTQMLFSNATFTLVCGLTLPWLWAPTSPRQFALMLTLGLIGAGAQYLLFEGFRLADASLVAPFEYTALVWAFCLSFLVWGDIPKRPVFVGAGLILASGLLVIGGEWHRARRARRAPVRRAGAV
jgi:drug/metabolite transporter (DMT)-like permease